MTAPATCARPGSPWRRLLESSVLLLSAILIFRTVAVEPYHVPTGSMAPALAGDHKATICPRCGYPVLVGRAQAHAAPIMPTPNVALGGRHGGDNRAADRRYASAACPNCGCYDLDLGRVAESSGDRLLVNKGSFELRRPRRWEMAVFRAPAEPTKAFVKRVVGLPGETVQVRGGDVYINGALARKSLRQCKAVRIPVFDSNYQPVPSGWQKRWLTEPETPVSPLDGTALRLDASADDAERWLTYRHWLLEENREEVLCDIYGYNGGERDHNLEPVHDFMLECDVEVEGTNGWVAFAITDGLDRLTVEIPVAGRDAAARVLDARGACLRTVPSFHLPAGRSCHVELAFVDRRLLCAVDGRLLFEPADLPAAGEREPVSRPVKLGARGVSAVVRNFRLFRDINYTEAGQHAVREPVRLKAGEYFVLGDNSPNSDDSRFWADPAVPEGNFLGKPFLVHFPFSRAGLIR